VVRVLAVAVRRRPVKAEALSISQANPCWLSF